MKVLIDTNVILDVFLSREPHLVHAKELLSLCGGEITGCIIASQTTDIFYLMRRYGKNARLVKEALKTLVENVKVLEIVPADVNNALSSAMDDYEDALLACCAKRQRVEYIITRNEADFKLSPVPALSPQAFLEKFFEG